MARLSDETIRASMVSLSGWRYDGVSLRLRLSFSSFLEGIAFVNRVAQLAERVGHHPEITITPGFVTLVLTTHDAGGVTAQDIELGHRIQALTMG